MLDNDNRLETRNLVGDFIPIIILSPKDNPKAKNRKGTYILIVMYVPYQ